ncbi:DUF1801 domain-containing protein [Nocardioides albus]|uniref:YdhG-like domain-containing protein n=1 Tax=Nocardioides albus TaxID=1841 RepID=A0A7W5F8M5_9ACTN|nr:DUF1801 domain-containing protein [Nocardioides albus]MBB3089350.1 hypothetical protein [Nocardioides albus]GGU12573.1 hypothetical protein GCM10007979_08360 [Nocardioides albus]
MAKTTWTDADPVSFVEAVSPEKRRTDAKTLLDLLRRATGVEPRMFGTAIVGFGEYHYKYASGTEGDAPAASFSPRKAASVVYLNDGISTHEELLARLGPHTTGVGCLYLKDMAAVDLNVLEEIVSRSYATLTSGTYGSRAARAVGDHFES